MKKLFTLTLLAVLGFASSAVFAAGDAVAGKTEYNTKCAACHGANGEGMEMMKAPKLSGQFAWYTLSSLQRFKSGARGANDPAAAAMVPMASMLNDKQMADVSAYIETLK